MKRNRERQRIRILTAGFLALALVVTAKLYHVQLVQGDEFSEKADRQYVQSPGASFDRGSIYFTNKNSSPFSAATIKSGYILAINPALIEDERETFSKLSEVIELDQEKYDAKVAKKDDPYEELADRLPEETANKITELGLSGVTLHKQQWRFYPGEDIASHVLGFVSYSEDELTGTYGIEKQYESVLGRNNEGVYVNFFAEVFTGLKQLVEADERAGDIHLTIEPTVQLSLEKELEEIKAEWGSTMTAGVIINPKTGEIYALAATPNFNVNSFSSVEDPRVFSNPLVENVYEMGSIIKPLTVAAGLDAGVITPDTTYNDTGSIELDGYKISNYDGGARGVVPMQQVLNQSLNTGVAFIVRKLGTRQFSEYFKNFGLAEKSGIDLPNEGNGLVDNLDSPRQVEYATASFGQGIAFNPIVTVRALAALGNGGVLIRPHVVKSVDYEIGMKKPTDTEPVRRVISEEASETITRMLVNVVDDALLGGEVALENYTIAAKTGTAQIPGPNGKYYDDRYLHTFFGYFPAYDPQFLVFLMNYEPRGARYASETLTYPFADITKFLLNYYNISPDR